MVRLLLLALFVLLASRPSAAHALAYNLKRVMSIIGTIPVDPSDDAGDGGGNSNWVSPEARTTDPNSHTPAGLRLAAYKRPRHLQYEIRWVDPKPPFIKCEVHRNKRQPQKIESRPTYI